MIYLPLYIEVVFKNFRGVQMNTVQRIAKNTGLLFSAQIVSYLLAFLYMIEIARYLGPDGFGIFSYATSLVLIFGIFADLGLSTLVTREVTRDKSLENLYIGNFIPIKTILSILTYSILVLFVYVMGYSQPTVNVIYIFGLFMVVNGFSQLFFGLFQASEKMEYQSIALLLNNSLIFVGVIYGVSHGFGVAGFALIYFAAAAIVLIFSIMVMVWRYETPKIGKNFKFWKKSLKMAIPLSFAIVFSTIAFRVDTILLGLLQGDLAIGWYSAGFKLIEFLLFIPIVYTGAIFPLLSNYHVSSKDLLKLLYEKSFKYLFIISLPIAAAVTIFAKDIILILFQNSYYQSIIALQILIWSIPFLFLVNILGIMFVSINKQNLMLKITFLIMVLNIGLNIIFIPIYSYIGASVISVLTGIVEFGICFYFLSKYIEIDIKGVFSRVVVATSVMCVFLMVVDLNIYISIIFAALLYMGMLLALKTFTKDDYDIIRKLVDKQKEVIVNEN